VETTEPTNYGKVFTGTWAVVFWVLRLSVIQAEAVAGNFIAAQSLEVFFWEAEKFVALFAGF